MKSVFLSFLVVIVTVLSHPIAGKGIIYIDINSPQIRRFYLALPAIKDLGQLPQGMKEEVEKNLTQVLIISDLFYLMEKVKLPQQAVYVTEESVDFGAWGDAGAEFLLSVGLKAEGDAISIEFRLFDVVQGVYIAGKRYRGSQGEMRGMVCKMADEVIQQLTGERGIFQTKIAFVTDRTGNKEIALMDIDGRNEKMVTHSGSINISPAWHPDGRSLLYTCFQRRNPDLYQAFISTGSIALLSAAPGPNATPAWSPDGKRIALMMRGRDNTEIYLLNPQGKDPLQLTRSWDNKVSPAWSPDGKQIAFVSDRSGNPQIYILDLATRKLRRLTYEGRYNCSPAWSPKGDKIAFAREEEGRFHLYTIRPDGTDVKRLTKEGSNENPSWAPNGRHIAFASRMGGSYDIYIMTADGGGPWKVTTSEFNETEPAWSPWLQ
ncbi:MAG: Tol-Pal system beta propeller repeat protein TolB [Deltaproteobacteria bacterium RBG_13_52_11]|nr:MAG: Tol-Pal system beta propeller repeat protein TolB [Deltaproteobacteria bacterium RBG_13_52_11]